MAAPVGEKLERWRKRAWSDGREEAGKAGDKRLTGDREDAEAGGERRLTWGRKEDGAVVEMRLVWRQKRGCAGGTEDVMPGCATH